MSDTLDVTLRKGTGSRESRRLRRKGLVPAILYGHGEKCVDLATTREAVVAAVRHGSRVVNLTGAVKTAALVRELQWDTYGVEPLHIDFLRVSASDRIRVKVPVQLKGECPGQRAGGVLSLVLHDLELLHGAKAVAEGEDTVVSCMLPLKKGEEATGGAVAEPEIIGRKAAEEGEADAGKE